MYSQMCLFLLNSLYVFDHSSEGGSSPSFLRYQPCRPTPPPPLKKMGGEWGGSELCDFICKVICLFQVTFKKIVCNNSRLSLELFYVTRLFCYWLSTVKYPINWTVFKLRLVKSFKIVILLSKERTLDIRGKALIFLIDLESFSF